MISRWIRREGEMCIAAGCVTWWTVHPLVGFALVGAGALKCKTARALARRGW